MLATAKLMPIITVPDPILRHAAAPVAEITDGTRQLLDDMVATMYDAPGIGLAAPQVNISQRVIVIDCGKDNESELIKMVNNTRYGLAGSIWTKDVDRGRRLSESIETGMIWINTWLHRDLRVRFGGVKDSGVGREGGKWSLGFFSEAMNVCVKHE